MASTASTPPTPIAGPSELGAALDAARRSFYEDPAAAVAIAVRAHELGLADGDPSLAARGLALQGAISLHRGDLPGALGLIVEAEGHAQASGDPVAACEVAALRAQIGFFTGSYSEALAEAERALRLADEAGAESLRIYARRATCLVFGNIGVEDWPARLQEMLEMSIASRDAWEEAISRNDLACLAQAGGDLTGAVAEIDRAFATVARAPGPAAFARAVLHSTRADIHLLAGRPTDALADAQESIELLVATGEANPYVLGVTVRAEVQARMALGQLDGAREAGQGALEWLGDRVPQTRSLILTTLATELRAAGATEAAYDALAQAAELERQAFRELSQLQLSLERATLQIAAARRESGALAAKNRELARAHSELERRAAQLESLQGQLREQAERDWLTGLYNRRFLAAELERLGSDPASLPLSLAVLDLDHFKSINDRFGHAAGDEVLRRVAELLGEGLRHSDIAVRSGGEEFLVLMPRTGAPAARRACERLAGALRGENWDRVADGLGLTVSVGLATTTQPGSDLDGLAARADERLYAAKRAGRDRVAD